MKLLLLLGFIVGVHIQKSVELSISSTLTEPNAKVDLSSKKSSIIGSALRFKADLINGAADGIDKVKSTLFGAIKLPFSGDQLQVTADQSTIATNASTDHNLVNLPLQTLIDLIILATTDFNNTNQAGTIGGTPLVATTPSSTAVLSPAIIPELFINPETNRPYYDTNSFVLLKKDYNGRQYIFNEATGYFYELPIALLKTGDIVKDKLNGNIQIQTSPGSWAPYNP